MEMSLWTRMANVFRGERVSRGIDEELETHVAEAVAEGRDVVEARRALGSALRLREESRDAKLLTWLDSLLSEAVFGRRQLKKTKVTSAEVLSLALATGGCTAAFRLIDALYKTSEQLVLLTIGVYSVLAYTTARRTHEIGIRMALGAEGADVLGLVIKTGLWLVFVGAAIGLLASLALSRVIETQLWGVSACVSVRSGDPGRAVVLLLATGVVACWIPARRASRVEPLVALRYE
jgi:hypothetical protein